ncbi:MAG: NUDIX domain-containing protein [Nanoarchaeota archaeon]|nr:NUDIX domain-containing protein [Nanoarchaeota archaeon]
MSDHQSILDRREVAGKHLYLHKGLCQANFQDPQQPRDYAWYNRFVIKPLIESGHISDGTRGPFDDRKLRYHLLSTDDLHNEVTLYLGITHFRAYQADLARDELQVQVLKQAGENQFSNEYAFFSRPLAVTVLPITREGTAFIGERGNKERGGLWNAVAGYVRFRHPGEVDLKEDLLRELQEEFGIDPGDLVGEPQLVGLSCSLSTGEAEPSYIVQTKVPEEYFTSGRWKERVSEREHKRLERIATLEDRDELLMESLPSTGERVELMHATEHVLRSLKEADLSRLE